MKPKADKVVVFCSQCMHETTVLIPRDWSDQDEVLVSCAACKVRLDVSRGRSRIVGHVEGESADDVSRVVHEIVHGKGQAAVNLSIHESTIGFLNLGEIEDVNSISVNVAHLKRFGRASVAEAIAQVTEAVATNSELSQEARAEVLDELRELGQMAVSEKFGGRKPGVLKAVLAHLSSTLGAAGGLAEVWSTWGPMIRSAFGL
jgi:hypothetical protein